MKTAKERLEFILKELGSPTLKTFAEYLNINLTKISNLKKGLQKTFPYEIAKAICIKYPRYNLDWIMTGNGDPFVNGYNTLLLRDAIPEEIASELMKIGERLQEIQIANQIYDDVKFAKIIGITEKRYLDLTTKGKLPETDELVSVINHFNVSADWLLFGRENKQSCKTNAPLTIDELTYLNKIIDKLNQQF